LELEEAAHVEALPEHLQRRAVEARAAALLAGDPDVREEVHLDPDRPLALAGRAAPGREVEAEAVRPVAAHPRERQLREELAHAVPEARVGRGVRAGALPDRRLVDRHE